MRPEAIDRFAWWSRGSGTDRVGETRWKPYKLQRIYRALPAGSLRIRSCTPDTSHTYRDHYVLSVAYHASCITVKTRGALSRRVTDGPDKAGAMLAQWCDRAIAGATPLPRSYPLVGNLRRLVAADRQEQHEAGLPGWPRDSERPLQVVHHRLTCSRPQPNVSCTRTTREQANRRPVVLLGGPDRGVGHA